MSTPENLSRGVSKNYLKGYALALSKNCRAWNFDLMSLEPNGPSKLLCQYNGL